MTRQVMSKTPVWLLLIQGDLEINIKWQHKDKFLLLKVYICKAIHLRTDSADSELEEEMDQELQILIEEY